MVNAAVERGTVADALANQRYNVNVVNSVTAEEIARSPDGDAAAVVQRISGVTVQEGKFIFVRGLGERYTTTSLNGARIPSPEPERKVVPLDLFPSGILQTITTAKTFTPDLSGDFSGAQVDIQTREFPAERAMSLSISAGGNDASTGVAMPRAPRAGNEQFTFGAGNRQLPAEIAAAGTFEPMPNARTGQRAGARLPKQLVGADGHRRSQQQHVPLARRQRSDPGAADRIPGLRDVWA